MKKVPLSKGKAFAIVDDSDFGSLTRWKWKLTNGYASRGIRSGKKVGTVFMHRVVNKTPDGLITDHINGDKLDNRKENLRSCTHSQNAGNRASTNKHGLKGVAFHNGKWHAHITHYLGSFKTK